MILSILRACSVGSWVLLIAARKVRMVRLPTSTTTAPSSGITRLANQRLDEYGDESGTKPWGIAAAKATRCTGHGVSSRLHQNGSATAVGSASGASSTPATPREKYAPPGTPPKPSEASTTIDSPALGLQYTHQLADDLQDPSCPPEINQLGRTISRWCAQTTNWHISTVTNGPTEALNNLIKRVKRAGFGFRNFANYRIRTLLYAGKPHWNLLATVAPHQNPMSQ